MQQHAFQNRYILRTFPQLTCRVMAGSPYRYNIETECLKAMADCRSSKVQKISELLYAHLCRDHLEEIRQTGSLLPTKSLRHRVTRERLAWASSLDGRWFTACVVRDALKDVMKNHSEIELPSLPGFTRDNWIDSTSTSLTTILQRAKKSSVPTAMDNLETQPYEFVDLDPHEDWAVRRMSII